jgi:hypothetical protein
MEGSSNIFFFFGGGGTIIIMHMLAGPQYEIPVLRYTLVSGNQLKDA